jgi:membrane-bound serine protease (ClpP class)
MDWWVYTIIAVCVVVILFFIIRAVVHGQQQRPFTGHEGMVGEVGVAQSELNPKGAVFIDGEQWKAISENGKIDLGEEVIVTKVDGLKLRVIKKSD